MFATTVRFFTYITLVIAVLMFIAWSTSSDPKYNKASLEETPFEQSVAAIDSAITLAQFENSDGDIVTLLVETFDSDVVTGIDLKHMGAIRATNPFEVLASVGNRELRNSFESGYPRTTVNIASLLPSGPSGNQHIGIGLNFPEHAEESGSAETGDSGVFNFPKFGTATPARTSVASVEGALLDYEVELCIRFDRPIASIEDFDSAVKGIFLCADFTDRIALLELVNPDNLNSGYGFSDAKSGTGFFPTGPLLVIPNDWKSFTSDVRMMTHINGEARQDARGKEMSKDFHSLTKQVLNDMEKPRFYYNNEFFKLAPNKVIESGMALMSGTSEGVIFTPPARHDYVEIVLSYVFGGGLLAGKELVPFAIDKFIQNEQASGHYLKPGDTVKYQATYLGDIVVNVQANNN